MSYARRDAVYFPAGLKPNLLLSRIQHKKAITSFWPAGRRRIGYKS
jgi:hypothetical protein